MQCFAQAPLETAAFVLAKSVRTPDGQWRLLAREVLGVEKADYLIRTPTRLILKSEAVAEVRGRARAERLSVLLVHTHPGGQPGPSVQDLEGGAVLRPVLHERLADLPRRRLILRPDGLDVALFVGERDTVPLEVQSVGEQLRIFRADDTDTDQLAETYQRQALAFGELGQRQLRRLRIGVVGAGGTGSLVLQRFWQVNGYCGVQ